MGPGTIYGSLQRMEDAGLVRELTARGDDRRRVFGLQPAGRRALEAEAQRLTRLAALVRAKRLIAGEALMASPVRLARALSLPAASLPARFRARFASDLEADFADLLRRAGPARRGGAWSPISAVRAVTHAVRARPGSGRAPWPPRRRQPMGSLLADLRHAVPRPA